LDDRVTGSAVVGDAAVGAGEGLPGSAGVGISVGGAAPPALSPFELPSALSSFELPSFTCARSLSSKKYDPSSELYSHATSFHSQAAQTKRENSLSAVPYTFSSHSGNVFPFAPAVFPALTLYQCN
jgi:hypothetical protein